MLNPTTAGRTQRGFSLIEGLVAIVVFSLGALGAMHMQARAVQLASDSQDRAQAAFLSNKLITQVALQDATAAVPDPSEAFLLSPTGCGSGAPGGHPASDWFAEVCASFDDAQATIARPTGVTTGFLAITIEWSGRLRSGDDAGGIMRDTHRYSVTNRFQWQ